MRLLIIDDDTLVTQALEMALGDKWKLTIINSPHNLPPSIESFSAALVDMHLTNNPTKAEGVQVLSKLKKRNPQMELVAMSGNLDRQLMEECLKAGASRFLAKPLSTDELHLTLEKIEAYQLLNQATHRKNVNFQWVGHSPASQQIRRQIADLKGEDGPLLIQGETGTGKEIVAQLIHQQEPQTPMISLNIAGVNENLFESEIFGHIKGSFTGADANKMGLAEAAHGGDLFLDEIEALSHSGQVKLLRFLETGEVRKVGSKQSTKVRTRVIAATNKPLEELVKEGAFREDLMWRLCGKTISLPPLRKRTEDIESLCNFFFSQDKFRTKELSTEALRALTSYSWPGNIRELKRVCEQLLFSSPLPIIRKEDIEQVLFRKNSSSFSTHPSDPDDLSRGLNILLQEYERSLLVQSTKNVNSLDDVSRQLQISRSSLYKKLKDYNIDWKA